MVQSKQPRPLQRGNFACHIHINDLWVMCSIDASITIATSDSIRFCFEFYFTSLLSGISRQAQSTHGWHCKQRLFKDKQAEYYPMIQSIFFERSSDTPSHHYSRFQSYMSGSSRYCYVIGFTKTTIFYRFGIYLIL